MFKRVFLGLIFLVSIAWIGYIGYGIFTATNDYSEVHVFNENDGAVIIVNRASEVNFNTINGFGSSPSFEIAQSLSTNYKMGFFSLKRAQFILVGTENWNVKSIKNLFNGENIQIDSKHKSFTVNSWKGTFKNDRLYASLEKFDQNEKALGAFIFDTKASASLITFGEKNKIASVLDIYYKANGKVDYISRDENIQQGKQIRDEELFASYISRKITKYHFYERDYYSTLDDQFSNGPMSTWSSSGFVLAEYKGEDIIISDYIDGQDPILILNDLQQTIDTSRFNAPLTATFPKLGKIYTVKYLEDLVVISQEESICDQFIADYKLGNTIAQSSSSRKRFYGDLPQAVSERFVADDLRSSKAVYNGYLLETKFGQHQADVETQDKSIAMPCRFTIADFHAFDQSGEVVALGTKGEISYFQKGKQAWSKKLDSKPFGAIQIIELHGGGKQHILLNTEDAVHLWDLNGKSAPGFPIQHDEPALNEVKFYRWKDKGYFLVASGINSVLQFDSEGRELAVFKSEINPSRKVDVWASQERLFFGFASPTQFEMFEVAQNKQLRSFEIPANSQPIKTPNQLFHYGIVDGQFYQIDQKGTRTNFEKYTEGKLLPVNSKSKNPTLIVRSRNTLHFINQKGIEFGKLRMPFNEIEGVNYFNLNSGKTVVSILDGLENNVYLYNMNGTKLTDRSLEGKTKVNVSSTSNSLIITTVVDDYVIQYFEN